MEFKILSNFKVSHVIDKYYFSVVVCISYSSKINIECNWQQICILLLFSYNFCFDIFDSSIL